MAAGGIWEISVLSARFCCEPKLLYKTISVGSKEGRKEGKKKGRKERSKEGKEGSECRRDGWWEVRSMQDGGSLDKGQCMCTVTGGPMRENCFL